MERTLAAIPLLESGHAAPVRVPDIEVQSVILPSWLISSREPCTNVISNWERSCNFPRSAIVVGKSNCNDEFLYVTGKSFNGDYFWLKAGEMRAGAKYGTRGLKMLNKRNSSWTLTEFHML
jgi:hypothetical protein